MRFTQLIFTILILCLGVSSFGQELDIYRNDGTFTRVQLSDSTLMGHCVKFEQSMCIDNVDFYGRHRADTVPIPAIDSCVLRLTSIPDFYFSVPSMPEAAWVSDKENYVNATLDIVGNGSVESKSGLSLSIKGRGNSTWYFAKKPMRMKFSKKTSICGFKSAKSYVLLADYIDPSMCHNAIGLWLARRLETKYANHTQPCNVYFNGNYAGLYLLTEKVGINSGSVNIDEDTGILFELSSEYDEPYQFRSTKYHLPVMVKDPDFDELYGDDPDGPTPQERLDAWKKDFNLAEAAVRSNNVFEYFDLDAAVNYLLVENIACNDEIGWPKSVYLFKETPDSTYKLGPIWDLDVAFNHDQPTDTGYSTTNPGNNIWLNDLFYYMVRNPRFVEAYKARFEYFKEVVFPEMLDFLTAYAHLIEPSVKCDSMKWPVEYNGGWYYRMNAFDTAKHIENLRNWLITRVDELARRVNDPDSSLF